MDNKILKDIIVTELEKYHKLIIDQGLEGREKVEELIEILESEEEEDNGTGIIGT